MAYQPVGVPLRSYVMQAGLWPGRRLGGASKPIVQRMRSQVATVSGPTATQASGVARFVAGLASAVGLGPTPRLRRGWGPPGSRMIGGQEHFPHVRVQGDVPPFGRNSIRRKLGV
jgi:hypothetical protein